VELGVVFDIEDADVRVLPSDPPDVSPRARSLQLLESLLLGSLQALCLGAVEGKGDVDIHLDHEKHQLAPPIA
jgi:hypothetical protein